MLVGVFVRVGVAVGVFVDVRVGVAVAVNVGVPVAVFVGVCEAAAVGVGVGVLVGTTPDVVNVFVELVAVELPSLATAYHSYSVPAVRPDQVMLAFEPDATVVVPISVKGAALPCIS